MLDDRRPSVRADPDFEQVKPRLCVTPTEAARLEQACRRALTIEGFSPPAIAWTPARTRRTPGRLDLDAHQSTALAENEIDFAGAGRHAPPEQHEPAST